MKPLFKDSVFLPMPSRVTGTSRRKKVVVVVVPEGDDVRLTKDDRVEETADGAGEQRSAGTVEVAADVEGVQALGVVPYEQVDATGASVNEEAEVAGAGMNRGMEQANEGVSKAAEKVDEGAGLSRDVKGDSVVIDKDASKVAGTVDGDISKEAVVVNKGVSKVAETASENIAKEAVAANKDASKVAETVDEGVSKGVEEANGADKEAAVPEKGVEEVDEDYAGTNKENAALNERMGTNGDGSTANPGEGDEPSKRRQQNPKSFGYKMGGIQEAPLAEHARNSAPAPPPRRRYSRRTTQEDVESAFGQSLSKQDFMFGKPLGTGMFGRVFMAKHKSSRKTVVIKTILIRKVKETGMEMQLENEIEIHTQLRHRNIIRLYTHFRDDRHIYLVMEFAKNGNLYERIKSQGSIPEAAARRYVRQIASALEYIHARGIIHRDIKPENILIDKNGDLKLCDFGWASRMDSHGRQTTFCGTNDYLPPEIVSHIPYNEKADMWSFGVLIFEILFGFAPFYENSVQITWEKIKNVDYSIPSNKVSSEAEDLIRGLLRRDPKERLSAAEVMKHPFCTMDT